MDSKTVFVRTRKGDDEIRSGIAHLSGDIKRTLLMVDGTATFGEISKRAAPSLRGILETVLKELESDGYIQGKVKVGHTPKLVIPLKKPASPSPANTTNEAAEELDFTAMPKSDPAATPKQSPAALDNEATNLRNKLVAARSKASADTLLAEEARAKAEAERIDKARAIAETRARTEKEAQAKTEAERIAKQQTAVEAKARAEAELIAKERAAAEAKVRAEKEAQARAEAEHLAKEQAAAAKVQAEKEARARAEAELIARERAAAEARVRAEKEAQARAEAERFARERAAAAQAQAELEMAQARAELEAAKIAAEIAARARAEAERRAEELAAAAKAQAELEIARARAELEAVKIQAAEEIKLSRSQNMLAFDQATFELNKQKSGVLPGRTSSATVLFFDVVGYTKLSVNKQIDLKKQFNQLVSTCLDKLGAGEHIILDTGDGAAIGFLQHPDDALTVAMEFRKAVTANNHEDYPALQVRIGIHLGPINVVEDMNGRSNMVGDGINDAQRVMSFAGIDQIYISRPYHDFVSRLNDEYADLFQYRGVQNDKHGREHQVYELVDASSPPIDESSHADLPADSGLAPFEFDKFTFATTETPIAPARVDHVAPETPAEFLPLIEPAAAIEPDSSKEKLPIPKQDVSLPSEKKSEPEKLKSAEEQISETAAKQLAETRRLADAQAKSWAKAEQRAISMARVNAEKIAQQAAQPRVTPIAATRVQRAQKPRQPVPWGKIGAALLVSALITLVAAPALMPTRGYIPALEQQLSKEFQQPVHIGSLTGRILPAPRIELHDVSIGSDRQVQLRQAQANFSLTGLFSPVKTIDSVDLQGLQASGAKLQQITVWLQQLAVDNTFPIKRILISQGMLDTEAIQLGEIHGEIGFNQAGRLSQAHLSANAGKYLLDIDASKAGHALVAITVHGSALPLLPNWTFDDLTATGEINKDNLIISDFDSRIYGGILLGDARLDWHSGWSMQGTLVAKTITMQNMISSLSGDMNGTVHFKMQAESLSKLTDEPIMNGNFVIKKGIINGMDMVETARLRSTEIMPGGRTHFDELSGDCSYANNTYHFRQLKMSAGILNASGAIDMIKQQLSGKAFADLTITGQSAVPLQIGGLNTNPTLRAIR